MAQDTPKVSGGNGIDNLASLFNLIGGQKQTTSANTDQLQAILAQLQGADYSGLLKGIFQDAAGQIPGFTQTFQNAMGARSANNGGMQAALSALLQQTALKGQQQTIDAQLKNQGLQGNIAAAISGANKTVTQGPNMGMLGPALGVMQLLGKSGVTDKIAKIFQGGGSDLAASAAGPLTDTASSYVPAELGPYTGLSDTGLGAAGGITDSLVSGLSDVGTGIGDFFSGIGDTASDWGSAISDWWGGLGFKDGGLVDSKSMIPRYAGGGQVIRSPGGRTTGNPSYTPADPMASTAQFGAANLRKSVEDALGNSADGGATEQEAPTANGTISPAKAAQLMFSLYTNPIMFVAQIMRMSIQQQQQAQAAANAGGGGNAGGKGQTASVSVSPISAISMSQAMANAFGAAGGNAAGSVSGEAVAGWGSEDSVSAAAAGFGGSDNFGGEGDAGDEGGDASGGSGDSGIGGDSAGAGWKSGGAIKGPGTGTSDSIQIKVSDGEYVIPAAAVRAKGTDFFDKLVEKYTGKNPQSTPDKTPQA